MKMLLPSAVIFLLAFVLVNADVPLWKPEVKPVRRPDLISRSEIPLPGAELLPVEQDLNTLYTKREKQWKLSPIINSDKPFPANEDLDKGYEKADFDDSSWRDVDLVSWWNYNRKAFSRSRFPYSKGWYRTSIHLSGKDLDGGKRIIVKVGYHGTEYLAFFNGKVVGRHAGNFTSSEFDVTEAAKPGSNSLVFRCFNDHHTDRKEGVLRGYGAMYGGTYNLKGGLWGGVSWSSEPRFRIRRILITPNLQTGTLTVKCSLLNPGRKTESLSLDFIATPAMRKDAGTITGRVEKMPVTLQPGWNEIQTSIKLNNPSCWSPESPYLYFLFLRAWQKGRIVSAAAERFGFREMKVANGRFYLNGKPVFLYGNSWPSALWGGSGHPRERLENAYRAALADRANGYNIIRTSHQPGMPYLLDVCDEVGLMVMQEWCWSFLTNLAPEFEANNLREVEEFILEHYNRPCITLWSMGNEIIHANNPRVVEQLKKQTALVRRLDEQKRPLSVFSGSAEWNSYGRTPLDTDVRDLHTYTTLRKAWTTLPGELDMLLKGDREIYGEKKASSLAYIAFETIGFGWGAGIPNDVGFYHSGDMKQYEAVTRRKTSFGSPNVLGFLCAMTLPEILNRNVTLWVSGPDKYNKPFFELLRLHGRYTGFLPWNSGGSCQTAWTQEIYPALHGNNLLPVRNPFSGSESEWTLTVLNDSAGDLRDAVLELSLSEGRLNGIPFARIPLGKIASGSRSSQKYTLKLPDVPAGRYQLRLAVKEKNGRIAGRNSYGIFVQPGTLLSKRISQKKKIFILDTGNAENLRALSRVLKEHGLQGEVVPSFRNLPSNSVAVVPPELEKSRPLRLDNDPELDSFVKKGGTLLILEQHNSKTILPGNHTLTEEGNSFLDVSVPDHPVFTGMDRDCFNLWQNPDHGFLVTHTCDPFTRNALAVKGPYLEKNNTCAAILEGRLGKGRIFFSQLEAFRCRERDSSAAKYLVNLFEYLLSGRFVPETEELIPGNPNEYTVSDQDTVFIDLRRHANMGFRDEKNNDGRGGWSDQGNNDFRIMPTGKVRAGGVLFQILDPGKNNGKSCLTLGGSSRPQLSRAFRKIPVGSFVKRLFFLHASAWPGGHACTYRMHYSDGESEDFKVMTGIHIGDFWWPAKLSEAKVGITGQNQMGRRIGTFVTAWQNPHPEKKIDFIDMLDPRSAYENSINWVPGHIPTTMLVAVSAEIRKE